jgi:dTDP-4-dehydrorhamnose reductase
MGKRNAKHLLMNRTSVAVLGATGQFGTDLVEVLREDGKFEVMPLSHADCDCTDERKVARVIGSLHPDTVVNCAAYVRVDDCEEHASEAFNVNAIGALNVARACASLHALCVYVSTDYVFDGTKDTPYVESDPTGPVNVYGASKLAGEQMVRQATPRWIIVRMASLFGKTGARGKGGNFVETVISKAQAGEILRVVNDITMSPTYARDAAEALALLLRTEATGLFHVTNKGACTWYGFAKAISDLIGVGTAVVAVSSSEFPNRARRPKNSALMSDQARRELRPWQDGLKAYLLEKGHIPEISKQNAGSR